MKANHYAAMVAIRDVLQIQNLFREGCEVRIFVHFQTGLKQSREPEVGLNSD